MSIINLEERITTSFSCFLPSNSREQRSNVGILGIAAHSMLVSLPPYGLFVAFAGTKHCCLTAINRYGALCCPDFPRDRGLKQMFFFPYPAIDRHTIFISLTSVVHATSAFRRRAAYGNRTRLLGLGSRCTTDVLMPQFRCKITTFFSYMQKKRQNTCFSRNEHVYFIVLLTRASAFVYIGVRDWPKTRIFAIWGVLYIIAIYPRK